MSVVKDLGMKNPYVGQTALLSGEIAEDFAAYYVQSEQTPTLQALGVLVSGETVLSAGGVLLQTLPGARTRPSASWSCAVRCFPTSAGSCALIPPKTCSPSGSTA